MVCNYCGKQFGSYISVRLHERVGHPLEYNAELESRLPEPDSLVYERLAAIEARAVKGAAFINEMARATGLTKDQVRHRRTKPEYKIVLENTKRRVAAEAKSTFASSDGSAAATSTGASTSKTAAPKAKPPSWASLFRRATTAKPTATASSASSSQPPAPSSAPSTKIPHTSPPVDSAKCPRAGGKSDTEPRPSTSYQSPDPPTPGVKRRRCTPSPADVLSTITKKPKVCCRSEDNSASICEDRPPATASAPSGEMVARTPGKRRRESSPSDSVTSKLPCTMEAAFEPAIREPGVVGLPCLRRRSSRLSESMHDLAAPDVASSCPFRRMLTDVRVSLPGNVLMTNCIDAALLKSSEEVKLQLDNWVAARFLKPTSGSQGRPAAKSRRPPQGGFERKAPAKGKRVSAFKKAQDLWTKNRASLAERVLSGVAWDSESTLPPIEDVERLYRDIFESESPRDVEPVTFPKAAGETYYPIAQEEIKRALHGWRDTAPGPDGIRVSTVRSSSLLELAVVFNIIFWRNVLPSTFALSKTSLIFKGGDRTNAANYRPITVSSAVQRLLHRVLLHRIQAAVTLNSRQRGFVACDGTIINAVTLDAYVRSRTARGSAYNVVSLDLRKAFDMVSHHAVLRALKRHGVDEGTQSFLSNSLMSACTLIRVGHCTTAHMAMRRGVKQGDPLSPLLFNLVMDELLDRLEQSGLGGSLGTAKIPALAFADDLVLMEDSDVAMTQLLDMAADFFSARGLEINASKCAAISASPLEGKSVVRTRPIFRVKGRLVNVLGVLDSFRYLGHQYGARGLLKPSLTNLPTWLHNIGRAPLKPDQKFGLVRDFVIPRLLYTLQNSRINAKTLSEADRLIRSATKKFLHLHLHTADQHLYAAVRDGGLGLMPLRRRVPEVMMGRLRKALMSDDPSVSALGRIPVIANLLSRLQGLVGEVNSREWWRQRVRTGATSRGLEAACEDSASRQWLSSKPRGWTGGDFVRAIHLRAANLPTAGIPSNPPEQRWCRGGCGKVETLCHVLQACPVTHWERIGRHNFVATKISDHARRKGWRVEEEPHVRHRDGTLYKPDLVIHRAAASIVVCDVQVSWEGDRGLGWSWEQKRLVYDQWHFMEAARERWPGKEFTFAPIIVGARGIWSAANKPTHELLAIPPNTRANIVNGCLKWGASIHRAFMKAIWSRQRPHRGAAPRPAA